MLRWLVGLLLLANLGFWAWSGGALDGWVGARAQGEREPERLAQQVRPESIRLVPTEAAAAATTAAGSGAASVPGGASAVALGSAGASSPAGGAAMTLRAASAARNASDAARGGTSASASAVRAASAASSSVAVRTAVTTASAPVVAAAASAASAEGVACLEAGPFTPAELRTAQATFGPLVPIGRWTDRRTETPGLWIIYMGRYTDPELLQKKKDEVAGIRVAFEDLHGFPDLEPGLLLGRFDSRAAADAALAKSVTQGIRTARVVLVRAPEVAHHLRVPAADAQLAARLADVRLGPAARAFQGC